MKRLMPVSMWAALTFAAAGSAGAQTVGLADDAPAGLISVGAFAGREFDHPDHSLLLGGDGRLHFGEANFEINPRFSFRPFDDGSTQQLDLNILTNHRLSNPGRFRPYSGVGIGVQRVKIASAADSAVGLNLISGVRLAMRPGAAYEPFLQAQYTILKKPSNSFTLVIGSSFSFR